MVRTGVTLLIDLCLGFLLPLSGNAFVIRAGAAAASGSGDEMGKPGGRRTEAPGRNRGTGRKQDARKNRSTGRSGVPVAARGSRKKDRPSFPEFLERFLAEPGVCRVLPAARGFAGLLVEWWSPLLGSPTSSAAAVVFSSGRRRVWGCPCMPAAAGSSVYPGLTRAGV